MFQIITWVAVILVGVKIRLVQGFTFVRTCLNRSSPSLVITESLGLGHFDEHGLATIDSMNKSASVNVGSIAATSPGYNPRVAIGFNRREVQNSVAILEMSNPSNTEELVQCTMPLISWGSKKFPGDVHCVAYIGDTLHVVYDRPFGLGTVARVSENCTFIDLAESPARVHGSLNGPGGQCVGFDSLNQIAWLDNDDDDAGLVIFEAETNTTTLYSNISGTFSNIFGSLMADQNNNDLYWISDGLVRVDMETVQVSSATALLSGVGYYGSHEIFMDSSEDVSKLWIISSYTETIRSIPLNGDPIVEIPRPNKAKCQAYGLDWSYESVLLAVDFPLSSTTAMPATLAPSSTTSSPEPAPTPSTVTPTSTTLAPTTLSPSFPTSSPEPSNAPSTVTLTSTTLAPNPEQTMDPSPESGATFVAVTKVCCLGWILVFLAHSIA